MSQTTRSESSYFARDAAAGDERHRLTLINQLYDAKSRESLIEAGLVPGCRAAEVGYGNGLMLRWIAEHVGVGGRVVGVDLTQDYLVVSDLPSNVELRSANIEQKPLEVASYDVVYTRLLLAHLPDPLPAVRHFAEALAPGGTLVACDLYFPGMHAIDPGHSRAEGFDRALQHVIERIDQSGTLHSALGPRLASLLDEAGLSDVRSEVVARDGRGGDVSAQACTEGLKRVLSVCPDLQESAQRMIEAWTDPSFRFRDGDLYVVRGTRT